MSTCSPAGCLNSLASTCSIRPDSPLPESSALTSLRPTLLPTKTASTPNTSHPTMAFLRCRALHMPARAARFFRSTVTPPLVCACDMAARSHRGDAGSVGVPGVRACAGPIPQVRISAPSCEDRHRKPEMDDRDALQEVADEQAALRRVATLVAVEHDPDSLFAAVTEEAARVMGMRQANLARYEGEDGVLVLGQWNDEAGVTGVAAGERVTLDGQTVSGLVRKTGQPSRVDDYEATTGPLARRLYDMGIRSAVGAPVQVEGELWGVLTVQSERRHAFPRGAENRIQAFAELVSVALSEADARERVRRLADEQEALRRGGRRA